MNLISRVTLIIGLGIILFGAVLSHFFIGSNASRYYYTKIRNKIWVSQ